MNDQARERLLKLLEERRKNKENAADASISRFQRDSRVCRVCEGRRVVYRAIAADFDRFYKGSEEDKSRDPRFRAEPCPMCNREGEST